MEALSINSEYIILTVILLVCFAFLGVRRFYYLHMTPPGRAEYTACLRQRIASYDNQIFELLLYDTAAAIACEDTSYLFRSRWRMIRYLRRCRTRARIALFIVRRRL